MEVNITNVRDNKKVQMLQKIFSFASIFISIDRTDKTDFIYKSLILLIAFLNLLN